MADVRALNQDACIGPLSMCENKFMNDGLAVVSDADLVGIEISVTAAYGGTNNLVVVDPFIPQHMMTIMHWPQKTECNRCSASFLSVARGGLFNSETLKPRIMETFRRIQTIVARIGCKRPHVRRQLIPDRVQIGYVGIKRDRVFTVDVFHR